MKIRALIDPQPSKNRGIYPYRSEETTANGVPPIPGPPQQYFYVIDHTLTFDNVRGRNLHRALRWQGDNFSHVNEILVEAVRLRELTQIGWLELVTLSGVGREKAITAMLKYRKETGRAID